MPPEVTLRTPQVAALTSATQVSISAWVLTTLVLQLPLQQVTSPDCTQTLIWFGGMSMQSPAKRLQAAFNTCEHWEPRFGPLSPHPMIAKTIAARSEVAIR